MIRLAKFIAAGGIASRRAAERLIMAGRVKVNGITVKEPGRKINPNRDHVEVDQNTVEALEKKYYLLFKPKGCLTTVSDPFGRPTVMDFFPAKIKKGLFPVGRLDMDTEGLLLLTNDGKLAFRLTHPRFQVPKKYFVTVKGAPSLKDLRKLSKGVLLEDGLTSPAEVKVASQQKKGTSLIMTLREGKKRQVKRMCLAIGHPVLFLKRVAFAFLNLEGLRPSDYRALTRKEIRKLKELVDLM
ncbi:MAG: rRNA pseudouridine synthase [Firmicutes bacterium]|nr:rRNA pseudouridine synthase [Bacillota bacterium]